LDEGNEKSRHSTKAAAARQIVALIERAIADERRACAEIAEEFATQEGGSIAEKIAAKILARGTSAEESGGMNPAVVVSLGGGAL
jgi:hypothetical protein